MKILIQIAFESDEGKTEIITDSISLARGAHSQDEIGPALTELRSIPAKIRRALNDNQLATRNESAPFKLLLEQGCPACEKASPAACCSLSTKSARITQLHGRLTLCGQIAQLSGNRIWLLVNHSMCAGSAIQIETKDSVLLCEIQRSERNPRPWPLSHAVVAIIVHSISRSWLDEMRSSFWPLRDQRTNGIPSSK